MCWHNLCSMGLCLLTTFRGKIMNEEPLKNILMLDDDDNFRGWLQTDLKKMCDESITFFSIGTPQEGLEILKQNEIHLILLDLDLNNEIDGVKFLKICKEKYPEVGVIIVSGQDDVTTAATCIKYGAFDYYDKAKDPLELDFMLKKYFERYEIKEKMSFYKGKTA